MDQRLIDLEMKEFVAEQGRRRKTLDLAQAGLMQSWLEAWKAAYAKAFDADGPELSEAECRKRIKTLEAFIAERESKQDDGTAGTYKPWLAAIEATMAAAVKPPPQPVEPPKPAEPEFSAEDLPTLDEMAGMDGRTRMKQVRLLTKQKPATADEATTIYADWLQGRVMEGADA